MRDRQMPQFLLLWLTVLFWVTAFAQVSRVYGDTALAALPALESIKLINIVHSSNLEVTSNQNQAVLNIRFDLLPSDKTPSTRGSPRRLPPEKWRLSSLYRRLARLQYEATVRNPQSEDYYQVSWLKHNQTVCVPMYCYDPGLIKILKEALTEYEKQPGIDPHLELRHIEKMLKDHPLRDVSADLRVVLPAAESVVQPAKSPAETDPRAEPTSKCRPGASAPASPDQGSAPDVVDLPFSSTRNTGGPHG